jgi:hypothetical protein
MNPTEHGHMMAGVPVGKIDCLGIPQDIDARDAAFESIRVELKRLNSYMLDLVNAVNGVASVLNR